MHTRPLKGGRASAARPHTAQPKCPCTRPPRAVGSVSSSNSHIHMHNAHARTPHATLLAHHACKGTLCHPATPTPRSPSSQAPQLNLESVQCTRDHALRDVGLAVSQQSLLFTYSGDERGGDRFLVVFIFGTAVSERSTFRTRACQFFVDTRNTQFQMIIRG